MFNINAMNIVIYNNNYRSKAFEQFMEVLFDSDLHFLASELSIYGITSGPETEIAIKRAMKICNSTHQNVRQHFKPVILCKDGTLQRDWKLSPLARKLVLLNANPSNPLVGRLQMELLNKI